MSAPKAGAYVVAQLAIHDRARYDRYAAAFFPTLQPFGGRMLAGSEAVVLLAEGFGRV